MRAMWLLALLACHGPKDTSPETGDDTAPETGESGDTAPDSEDTAPIDCGEGGSPPSLSTTAWSPTDTPPASGIYTFAAAADESLLYAGSISTGAWRSSDRGGTWTPLRIESTHTFGDMLVAADDPLLIYRSSGGVAQRSRDGGDSWETLPLGDMSTSPPNAVLDMAITPYDSERVYGLTFDGRVWRSTDGGDSWEERAELILFTDPHPMNPYDSHPWTFLPDLEPGGRALITDGYGLYRSDDDLGTWQPSFNAPVGGRTLMRDPLDPDHVLIGAEDGLLVSHDGGSTFSHLAMGTALQHAAWAPDGSWLVFGNETTLYVSTDGGESFEAKDVPVTLDGDLWIGADGRLLAAHTDGLVVSRDRGDTWEESSEGMEDPGMSVIVQHPACPNVVYTASRCGGGLYRSEDYGAGWVHDHHYLHYVMGVFWDPRDDARAWAVTDDRLLRSDDGGLTWDDVWTRYHFHGFAVDPEDSDVLLMGSVGSGEWADTQAHVYRSEDGGAHWEDSSTGLPGSDASAHTILHWPGAPDVVLLGTYKGGDVSHSRGAGIGLYRSTDRGASWTKTSLPEDDVAWLTEGAGGVVAATGDGLWRSVDEGLSWERLDGPSGQVLSVDFSGEVGGAYLHDGTAWFTSDGGESWAERSDGLRSAGGGAGTELGAIVIAADGRMAWVTDYNHGVARIGL